LDNSGHRRSSIFQCYRETRAQPLGALVTFFETGCGGF
jgi:hypothetical protein